MLSSSRHLRQRNVDSSKRIRVAIVDSLSTSSNRSTELIRSPSRFDTTHNESPIKSPPSAQKFIPTPNVRTIESHVQRPLNTPYKQPEHYVHMHLTPGPGILSVCDRYDLRHEDMLWCDERNAATKEESNERLTHDELEDLIDLFEKKAAQKTRSYDCQSVFGLAEACRVALASLSIHGRQVEDVYQFWINKRRRLNKTLMRIFNEPAMHDDPSPLVAFRTRESTRRISTRNPRRNDAHAFQKMRVLRRDLESVRHILNAIRKRETLKQQRLFLHAEAFDRRLAKTQWMCDRAKRKENAAQCNAETNIDSMLVSKLPRPTYEQDILVTRLKQRRKNRASMAIKRRNRRSIDHVQPRPCLHTSLFDSKFPDISEMGEMTDSSDAEKEEDSRLYDQVEQYLAEVEQSQHRKRRKRPIFSSPEFVGHLVVRYGRNQQIILDRFIFEKSGLRQSDSSKARIISPAATTDSSQA